MPNTATFLGGSNGLKDTTDTPNLRSVDSKIILRDTAISDEELAKRIATLQLVSWFSLSTDENLKRVAMKMQRKVYPAGTVIVKQGEPHKELIIVSNGELDRIRTINGQLHKMENADRGSTIGAYYVMNNDPCYSDAKCKTEVECYSISRTDLLELLENPSFAQEVVYNLNLEIRRQVFNAAELGRTPLLDQKGKGTPVLAISVAASIESFYRAAMNAAINASLSGQKSIPSGALFPNMHLQVPTRVVYINGFKGLRYAIDNSSIMKNVDTSPYPLATRLMAAVAPGLCMTPVSSLLEAYNAGHMNAEPIHKRWTRGLLPRGLREVIFGVGLNQLSDYCEERVDFISNKFMRNAAASMTAGVIAGYLSHVPHNFSTLKILNPHKTYGELFSEYMSVAEKRLPEGIPTFIRRPLSYALSVLAPRGLMIRTSQIVGSFIILNGTINAIQTSLFNEDATPSRGGGGVQGIDTLMLTDPRVELLQRVRLQRIKDPTVGTRMAVDASKQK